MSKGVLVDLSRCIGCGSCTVACKLWNELKFDKDKPTLGEKAIATDNNWTVVTTKKVTKEEGPVLRYVKTQCLHCEEPACVSACFAKALEKTPEGPVVYHPNLCVGCRYCMIACPFDVPKYQWEKSIPLIQKCQFCSSKIENGEMPACVGVCPTNTMTFGERDEMLALAKQRIASDPNKYVKHVYGEKEAGGTSWMYISDVPFEKLGFRTDVINAPLPPYGENFLKYTPYVIVGWGSLLTGMYMYTKRRNQIEKEENKNIKM